MKRRNVGIIAHVDAGKTTVTERILVLTGVLRAPGEVHHGTAKMDFDPIEAKRGITINAAAIPFTWRKHHFQLIDTPGHADFELEVERSLRVLDGAIVVLDASRGVEPQTEAVWRRAKRYGVPRVVFINKMDHPAADVSACLRSLEERLGAVPVLLDDREGAVDVLSQHDDALLEAALAGAVDDARFEQALIRATRQNLVQPVCTGAALKGVGIEALLDLAALVLPGPGGDASAPLEAIAFKSTSDEHGPFSWVRVYQGVLEKGEKVNVWSSGNDRPRVIRVGRLARIVAETRTPIDRLEAGEIGALIGAELATGDVINMDDDRPASITIEIPPPLMSLAVEPKAQHERDKLAVALARMCREDPSLSVKVDDETGETKLFGLGELHLEVALTRLGERLPSGIVRRRPEVACREAFMTSGEVTAFIKKQTGGPGSYAKVRVRFSPAERFTFRTEVRSGEVPANFFAAVEAGVRDEMQCGVLEGWPIEGAEVVLLGGDYHSNDSSDQAFRQAGALAVRMAGEICQPIVKEPWVDVVIEGEGAGRAASLIAQRRGRVREAHEDKLIASAPLDAMFGFATDLASKTQGRATFSMSPAGYEPK